MSHTEYAQPRHSLLLVDDEATNLQVLKTILASEYRLFFARDGERALTLAQQHHPDLILLDVMMPGLSGFDVCRALKRDAALAMIPVIFTTALADTLNETEGLEAGAVDYITKPVHAAVVRARVRTHLALAQTSLLRQTRLQTIEILGRAAEYKDNETGLHVIRMSRYSQLIARAAGWNEAESEDLLHSAPMHDVGKIGIPDAILRKPGALDAEEWAIMRQHPHMGAKIIGEHDAPMLRMAREVALYHHEKWDGSGYPQGRQGQDIPEAARIVAVADVFDALTSVRPYKPAWPVERAIDLLRQESGRHFEPRLVEHFLAHMPEITAIMQRWQEQPESDHPAAVNGDAAATLKGGA